MKLHEWKRKDEEVWVKKAVCCVCNKQIDGFYSRHGVVGTCSRECMKTEDLKPKYPDHSEEDFLKRTSPQ